MRRYSKTAYVDGDFKDFASGFEAAKHAVGGEKTTGAFEYGGVIVLVDPDSGLKQSRTDWEIAVVMGIGEIYKPLRDVALLNEAGARIEEAMWAGKMKNCSMSVKVSGGQQIAIEGFSDSDVRLSFAVHIFLRDNRGMTDQECVDILKGKASEDVLERAFPKDSPYLPFLVKESKWCGPWNGEKMQEFIKILSMP